MFGCKWCVWVTIVKMAPQWSTHYTHTHNITAECPDCIVCSLILINNVSRLYRWLSYLSCKIYMICMCVCTYIHTHTYSRVEILRGVSSEKHPARGHNGGFWFKPWEGGRRKKEDVTPEDIGKSCYSNIRRAYSCCHTHAYTNKNSSRPPAVYPLTPTYTNKLIKAQSRTNTHQASHFFANDGSWLKLAKAPSS